MFNWMKDDSLSLPGKFAWGALLLMVFLVPIAFTMAFAGMPTFTADAFDTPKVFIIRILSLVAIVSCLADIFMHGGKLRIIRWVAVALGIYVLWVTLSTVFALEPMQALYGKYRRYDGAWSAYIYVAVFFITLQYATSFERAKQMASALSWSSFIVAGYGLMQAAGIEPLLWGQLPFEANRSFSTFGNPDLLAGFLAFGVFINAGLALSESSKLKRIWYWVLFLMNSAVVITAFSRSIWVGAFVGAVVFIVLVVRQKVKFDSLDYSFMGATVLSALTLIGVSLTRKDAVMNFASRFVSIFKFNEGSAVTRFQIWDAAQQAIVERPLFGWGSDSFRMVFRRFQPLEYNTAAGYRSVADNVHNYPLQLAAGIGVVGAVVLYSIQFGLLALGVKVCWERPEPPSATGKKAKAMSQPAGNPRLLYAGLLAGSIAYMVHLIFGLSLPGTTVLLWICLAALVVPACRVIEVRPLKWAVPAIAACALLALVPSYVAIVHLWADHMHGQSVINQAAGDYQSALLQAEESCELNPYNDQYQAHWARLAVEASLGGSGTLSFDEAIKLCEDSLAKFPNEYDMYTLLLTCYEIAGQAKGAEYFEKGIALAEKQIKVMPSGLALRFNYAKLLARVGRNADAIEQLDYCLKWDPSFADAVKTREEIVTQQSSTQ